MTDDIDWKSVLAELRGNWRRQWLIWAIIYCAGFVLLWVAGLTEGWPFYAWAIGWALAKGIWDEAYFWRAVRKRSGPRSEETQEK